jgi:hypothetical protein
MAVIVRIAALAKNFAVFLIAPVFPKQSMRSVKMCFSEDGEAHMAI